MIQGVLPIGCEIQSMIPMLSITPLEKREKRKEKREKRKEKREKRKGKREKGKVSKQNKVNTTIKTHTKSLQLQHYKYKSTTVPHTNNTPTGTY